MKRIILAALLLFSSSAWAQLGCSFFCPPPPDGAVHVTPIAGAGWDGVMVTGSPTYAHKDQQGVVRFQGVLTKHGETANEAIAYIPIEYAPKYNQWFTVAAGPVHLNTKSLSAWAALVLVMPNGTIWVISDGAAWVSLAGISYIAGI